MNAGSAANTNWITTTTTTRPPLISIDDDEGEVVVSWPMTANSTFTSYGSYGATPLFGNRSQQRKVRKATLRRISGSPSTNRAHGTLETHGVVPRPDARHVPARMPPGLVGEASGRCIRSIEAAGTSHAFHT